MKNYGFNTKNFRFVRYFLALIIITISVLLIPTTAFAKTKEEKLEEIRKEKEARMDRLYKNGNLTQEAIDSISCGQSKRKPNSKSNKDKSNTNSNASSDYYSGEARGYVYAVDELHIVGLPTDSETGYTKSGDYGKIEP